MTNLELPHPAEMSATARAGEITAILAAAVVRTHVNAGQNNREVCLAFLPDQSVHTTPYQQEKL